MVKVDEVYMETLKDPSARHCVTCQHGWVNLNDEPCRRCMHNEVRPLTGMNRQEWKLKEGMVVKKAVVELELNGQMRMF
jgi:hypothetical protein